MNCHSCAVQNYIFVTYATNLFYFQSAVSTAKSIRLHMSTCTCVAVPKIFYPHKDVKSLVLNNDFPVDDLFCQNNLYGWRLTSFLTVTSWRMLSQAGYNIFSVDTDWIMRMPIPLQFRHDVTAMNDKQFLNVGLMAVKVTESTRSILKRVENRTYVGWNQGIFNDEIHNSNISCTSKVFAKYFVQQKNVHNHKKIVKVDKVTCRNNTLPIVSPPKNSFYLSWNDRWYNGIGEAKTSNKEWRRDSRCLT